MKASHFTDDPAVARRLEALRRSCDGKSFSDVRDGEGHQYVDLVMEGGGVLGIALVGYTYVLEEMGIRFLGVGGASAGAINALLVAAIAPPNETKSPAIIEHLANLDLFSLVDGGWAAKRLANAIASAQGFLPIFWRGVCVLGSVWKHLGVNPGDRFLDWLTGILRNSGVRSTADLYARMREVVGGLTDPHGNPLDAKAVEPYLALVAADVSTETKVQFPEMAPLYWADSNTVNPALYVRASMSIPFFFRPFRVRGIPRDQEAKQRWDKLAGYSKEIPATATFVDGGIMSNFPIDLFHEKGVPLCPTFGVKLGLEHRTRRSISTPFGLMGAVFNSARHCLDYDFIVRHPDYRHLVTWIDTRNHNWLNFGMADKEKIQLFQAGALAAADFLDGFDWEKYKDLRAKIAETYRP